MWAEQRKTRRAPGLGCQVKQFPATQVPQPPPTVACLTSPRPPGASPLQVRVHGEDWGQSWAQAWEASSVGLGGCTSV